MYSTLGLNHLNFLQNFEIYLLAENPIFKVFLVLFFPTSLLLDSSPLSLSHSLFFLPSLHFQLHSLFLSAVLCSHSVLRAVVVVAVVSCVAAVVVVS